MIYFDNNDTTPLDPEALESMLPYLRDKFGNPASLHQYGLEAENALDKARETIAAVVNVEPKEIIFTSGATESNNLAIFGAARARPDRRHIIISSIEHSSVSEPAKRLENEGYRVTRLPVDGMGYISSEALREALDDDTALVSIVMANHEIGVIQEIQTLAEIAHSRGVWFHTDAAQALGKITFDVKALGVDFASFNGHKLHGPKGVGGLYFNRKARPKRLMEGAPQEFDLRPGTENVPGIVGFAKAVEIAARDQTVVIPEVRRLSAKLAGGLSTIEYTHLNGPPPEERLPGNLNITFLYIEGEAILMHLSNRGVCVSSGSACSSKSLVPSNVLTAIGLLHEEAHGAIRFSLSRFNTEAEVDEVIEHTTEVVQLLRSMTAFIPKMHSEREGGKGFYRKR
ncbi:MAG: cysteine desulfurase [Calditrichaeota bacterium]|nr:cysteine desulfurase [Calditrichota bacterium]